MNNKTLLYIGGAALLYYLFKKNKKTAPKTLLVIETPTIQALKDTALIALISDLKKNPANYQNATVYLSYALAEQKRRITAGSGPSTTLPTGGGVIFSN